MSSPSGPSESPSLLQSNDDAINANDENISTEQLDNTADEKSSTIECGTSSSSSADQKTHNQKQLQAKQLIERYFHQLTVGCGNPDCKSENCASNTEFKALTPNQAAARAIKLFSEEAAFCKNILDKTESNFNPNPATDAVDSQTLEIDDKHRWSSSQNSQCFSIFFRHRMDSMISPKLLFV